MSSSEPQVTPPDFEISEAVPSAVAGAEVVAVAVLPTTDDPVDDGDGGPEGRTEGGDPPLTLGPGAAELVDAAPEAPDLLDALASAGASGRAGEVTTVAGVRLEGGDTVRVLLVGVGDAGATALRRAGAALARATSDVDLVASSVAAVGDDVGLTAFVEGATLGGFGFSMRRDGPGSRPPARVVLALGPAGDAGDSVLERAVGRARASWTARRLATTPSNVKTPAWLAAQAVEAAEGAGLRASVLDETELEKQGFGGIVGVGQAAAAPPRLVQLEYRPSRKLSGRGPVPHVVLVGKGITFDSGGLSIKPGQAMSTMKRDMTGAGVVAAVMAALSAVGCPVRVTGLLPLAENAVGSHAMRPGDVITHRGGRTTEVTNTDAEGRLVLADALAFAVEELEPDVLVDIATLTGGVKVALGQHLGGLFANDDALADALDVAGARSGEPLWRLPLSQEYAGKLSSKIADADNAPGGPPAITAALFLEPFVAGLPWAHLDIASVGDAPQDAHEWTAGPTGFGARLLLEWLGGTAPVAGIG